MEEKQPRKKTKGRGTLIAFVIICILGAIVIPPLSIVGAILALVLIGMTESQERGDL